MRWDLMIDKIATKARQRIGALSRVRHLLDSDNLRTFYVMFIRSIIEYNSVSWMGAALSHLNKLDRVQCMAQRIGNFIVVPLQARRETTATALALKLLDGQGRGELNQFNPALTEPLKLCRERTRQTLEGIQIVKKVKTSSLDVYRRSFM